MERRSTSSSPNGTCLDAAVTHDAQDNHHVAVGMHMVVTGAASIATVVGEGHVLAVALGNGKGGGIFHLEPQSNLSALRDPRKARRMTRRLQQFFKNLRGCRGTLDDARCQIIGGARLRDVLPERAFREMSESRVAWIEKMLHRRGSKLHGLAIGGQAIRQVTVDTGAGTIEVRLIGPALTAHTPALASEPLSPSAAAGDPVRHRVDMGCLRVTESPNELEALLGSCIGVAIVDRERRVGGLVHVLLPQWQPDDDNKARYADTAVPMLLEAVVAAGGRRKRLEAMIAGGGNTLFSTRGKSVFSVPRANVESARAALVSAGVPIVREDVGGQVARKMRVSLESVTMVVVTIGNRGSSA